MLALRNASYLSRHALRSVTTYEFIGFALLTAASVFQSILIGKLEHRVKRMENSVEILTPDDFEARPYD